MDGLNGAPLCVDSIKGLEPTDDMFQVFRESLFQAIADADYDAANRVISWNCGEGAAAFSSLPNGLSLSSQTSTTEAVREGEDELSLLSVLESRGLRKAMRSSFQAMHLSTLNDDGGEVSDASSAHCHAQEGGRGDEHSAQHPAHNVMAQPRSAFDRIKRWAPCCRRQGDATSSCRAATTRSVSKSEEATSSSAACWANPPSPVPQRRPACDSEDNTSAVISPLMPPPFSLLLAEALRAAVHFQQRAILVDLLLPRITADELLFIPTMFPSGLLEKRLGRDRFVVYQAGWGVHALVMCIRDASTRSVDGGVQILKALLEHSIDVASQSESEDAGDAPVFSRLIDCPIVHYKSSQNQHARGVAPTAAIAAEALPPLFHAIVTARSKTADILPTPHFNRNDVFVYDTRMTLPFYEHHNGGDMESDSHRSEAMAGRSAGSAPTMPIAIQQALLLLRHGASIGAAVQQNSTRLPQCAAVLSSSSSSASGATPLHAAVKEGLVGLAALLMDYGADVNARDIKGRTPLHWCAMNDAPQCIDLLLENGADHTLVDGDGYTCLAKALHSGNGYTANALNRKCGADAPQKFLPPRAVRYLYSPPTTM